ncbi:hypothetical protein SODALDRAFT_159638 [Sodiomyces alkalinus F11]|uniref:SAP domain-containing protein n=1 Tax=Sodiomyces alkalinus (strain CBS 110278 / VKM F-3762 / F11) TaxID=1314773 RepID=A0A3N2PY84_SODAK|nr:hypothetical protein SODALDRAFT_159638 [Sodiomyces alkalinus F11]ROT39442.1 hypothetical protein SODALDRAFT_159638 [Sodiomyces alkalinus F11]
MTDWSKLKVVDLRAELKRRGLQYSGLKQELVQRLSDDDSQSQTADPGNEAEDPPQDVDGLHTNDPQPVDSPPVPEIAPANATSEATAQDSLGDRPSPRAVLESTLPAGTDSQDMTSGGAKPVPALELGSVQPSEVLQDAQKRKRRSTSPPPDPKRAKHDDSSPMHATTSEPCALIDDAEAVSNEEVRLQKPPESDVAEDDMSPLLNRGDSREGSRDIASDGRPDRAATNRDAFELAPDSSDSRLVVHNAGGYDRVVESAIHPITRALYIKNFMRPLRPETVELHIKELAAPLNHGVDEHLIERFYLDQIRSHAYVVFFDISNAVRARAGLHGVVWPDESNRKPLWADFVPPQKVGDWIGEETNGGQRGLRGAAAPRWEVRYDKDENGNIVAVLDSGAAPPSSATEPRAMRSDPPPAVVSGFPSSTANTIPLGPRGGRGAPSQGPPVGPRSQRESRVHEPRRPGPGGPIKTTRTGPRISYQMVSEDLASRRVSCMRSHYTRDVDRDLGAEDEINRYTFESDDVFVDRGKEVFIGIRPPHREAKRQRQLGGGTPPLRGPPPHRGPPRRGPRGRPTSDRYLPGINEGGPFWQGGRDNLSSRLDDDRDGPPRRSGYNGCRYSRQGDSPREGGRRY